MKKHDSIEFNREETLYGPGVIFNDWRLDAGTAERAGGGAVFSGERFAAIRDDYPYGGGGDVETEVSFEVAPDGASNTATDPGAVIHFNHQPREAETRGIRVLLSGDSIRVSYRGNEIAVADHDGFGHGVVHVLSLITLAEEYEVRYNGRSLASGTMETPHVDNEGWVRLTGHGVQLRLLSMVEHAIVSKIGFPAWKRRELLYRESFEPGTFHRNWVVNRARGATEPELGSGRFVFRHMSNALLRTRFDGPIAVDYIARPIPTEEFSSGVTDAIFIWMADDPEGAFPEMLERRNREGVASLKMLLPHPFYWVDFGGTNNVTTRLRKNPYRHLMRQYTDARRLLERDRTYRITTVAHGQCIEFYVDGAPMIRVRDPHPHTRGHVGVRAFVADLEISGLEVHRIGS